MLGRGGSALRDRAPVAGSSECFCDVTVAEVRPLSSFWKNFRLPKGRQRTAQVRHLRLPAGFEGSSGAHEQWDHRHSALVEVLPALPQSQASLGLTRHGCAVCAYAADAESVTVAHTYQGIAVVVGHPPRGCKGLLTVNAYERNAAERAACIGLPSPFREGSVSSSLRTRVCGRPPRSADADSRLDTSSARHPGATGR